MNPDVGWNFETFWYVSPLVAYVAIIVLGFVNFYLKKRR